MYYFATQLPSTGNDVIVTADEDGRIVSVTDTDKNDLVVSGGDMRQLRDEADIEWNEQNHMCTGNLVLN